MMETTTYPLLSPTPTILLVSSEFFTLCDPMAGNFPFVEGAWLLILLCDVVARQAEFRNDFGVLNYYLTSN